jgi:hypothetical protein
MQVTEYNVGRWCLSEDDCIAQGIDFAAYERGVSDAAQAFANNRVDRDSVAGIIRGAGQYVTWGQAFEIADVLLASKEQR